MRVHVAKQSLFALQKAYMPELVQLVGADRALGRPREIPLHIGGGGCKERKPRAGEGHLRRGGEHEGAIGITRLLAEIEDVRNPISPLGEMVTRVGVVPETAK